MSVVTRVKISASSFPPLRALTWTRVPASLVLSVKQLDPLVLYEELGETTVAVEPVTSATQTPSVEIPAVVPVPALRSPPERATTRSRTFDAHDCCEGVRRVVSSAGRAADS